MSTLGAALSSPPLTIPTKKSEPFEWVKALKKILDDGGLDAEQFQAEIREIEHARSRCLGCGADRVGAQLHVHYYQQLCNMTSRFISCDSQESGFTWYLQAVVKVEQGAIAFEKANILFNLGAILSQMAAARPTSTADDLKAVFAEFQSAAAVLSYAKETFLHAPLPDLGKPSLEFLVQLMLAQAQEAAARKASLQHHTLVSSDRGQEDRTSSKLLARLWHSTAVHYATSLKHWYAPSAASLRKTVQETVPQLIDQKYKLATCLSLLFSGKHAWDEERAGEALARLDAALAICTSVTETDEQALQIQFTTLKDDFLVKMREKVEKENSLIFHEPIPAVVQELEPASLVSLQGLPAVLRSISDQEQRDIFSRAVPKHIRSEVARYREEVDKLVGYEGHLIEGLEREIEGLQNEAQNALSDPSAYSLLELRAKVKEPAMRLTESAKDVNATAGRLQEVIRAELDLNGERLKGLSRGLFDSSSITAEQRRPLLERIDVIAAVYESFATDLKELEQVPLADDAIKMEQRVREYSEGKFGLELGASSKTEKLSLPSVPSSSELLSSAREAYRELREEGSHSDITQELVKAKPGHSEQAIQDKLKTFDPLAAQIESSVTEARKRLQSCKINVEKAIAEHRSDPAFKEIDEQVRKRRMLLNFYDSELGKQREFLKKIQSIKNDLDTYRREFADIDRQVKSLLCQQPAPSTQPTQAHKDRDYLLSRLGQLGIEEHSALSGVDPLP